MVMGAIEIIAVIVLILSAIKILVILVNPKSWMKVVKLVYSIPTLTMIVALILSAVTLYYLLQSGITIIQIFAVMAFIALLACMTISIYFKDVVSFAGKMLKDRKFLRKAWLSILVWIVLIVWGLYAIFA